MVPILEGAEADANRMLNAKVSEALEEDGAEEAEGQEPQKSFAELLGPDCVIKRMDKDRKVLNHTKPEDMQEELMTRAAAQKRLGACAEHVKDMSRTEKLEWALQLKDRANEFYADSKFEEAAKLYNDCLVALDLDGSPEENAEVASRLQLPVCTNLAACMIEASRYWRCIEICDIALSVDPECLKALYRRGLARYRLGDHRAARPDFEAALRGVTARLKECQDSDAEVSSLDDLHRRVLAYLGHIRRFTQRERSSCQKMFDTPLLYADRPDAKPEGDAAEAIDDSDEAIEAALARLRGDWHCCPRRCCGRRQEGKMKEE